MHALKFADAMLFLSTLSLRRATGSDKGIHCNSFISIHALLAESDVMHALKFADAMLFLSTLSLRRATSQQPAGATRTTYFYPRSPCGERPRIFLRLTFHKNFYPRSPCGERLWPGLLARPFFIISIHALLAESDRRALGFVDPDKDFYPRSPCGERRVHFDNFNLHCVISIHALLAESDREPTALRTPHQRFLSTLSLRRATDKSNKLAERKLVFLSTLSLRRATRSRP